MSDIEFVGLVIRTTDGTVRAIDLSAENLKLTVNVEMPVDADDLMAIDDHGRIYPASRDRVSVAIEGLRRSSARELFTARLVEDGAVPFPAWERAE